MNTEQQVNKWGEVIAKAWQDEAFKKRLVSNPAAVLKEQGIEFPAGVQLRIVEDSESLRHLLLPTKPSSAELSENELEAVAGGTKGTLGRAFENAAFWLAVRELAKPESNRAAAQ